MVSRSKSSEKKKSCGGYILNATFKMFSEHRRANLSSKESLGRLRMMLHHVSPVLKSFGL